MSGELEFESRSAAETGALGERIGRLLVAGDSIGLIGELGAGKTAFVQGLARGLGVAGRITSPTFTIVNEHQGRVPLFHMDFYRLESARELDHVGFEDYFARDGVVVAEWADRFPAALPAAHLEVRFEITGEETRRLRLSGPGAARFASALQ